MEIDAQKSITSLKRLIVDVDSFDNLNLWIENAESLLRRIYPDRTFNLASNLTIFFDGDSRPTNKSELKQLLTGYIKELEELGHPQHQTGKIGQQININHTVNVNLILESLKQELTGRQISELKDAFNKAKTPAEKKNNIVDKLKSFGMDLTTNILSSIITNPSIIGGL